MTADSPRPLPDLSWQQHALTKATSEVKRLEAQNRELARQLIRNAALCGELEAELRQWRLSRERAK